ncbi:KNG1 protein, partial [Amia calva]|nr:KNG1 protein [Amia calva]
MLSLRLLSLLLLSPKLCLSAAGADKVQVFCDDKDVEAAVDLAILEYNQQLQHSNHFVLYQINEAWSATNDLDKEYSLTFSVKPSDCPAGQKKHWKECNYVANSRLVAPMPCTAAVLINNAEKIQNVISVNCTSVAEPTIVPREAPCVGCPSEISTNSPDLVEPVKLAVAAINTQINSSDHFSLHQIHKATRQVVAGWKYALQLSVKKTNCSKAEHKEVTSDCHPDTKLAVYTLCNATVYIVPWKQENDTHAECGSLVDDLVRRPPGWSPFRSVLYVSLEEVSTRARRRQDKKNKKGQGHGHEYGHGHLHGHGHGQNHNHEHKEHGRSSNHDEHGKNKKNEEQESSEESHEYGTTKAQPAPITTLAPLAPHTPRVTAALPNSTVAPANSPTTNAGLHAGLELPEAPPSPFHCPSKPWKQEAILTNPPPPHPPKPQPSADIINDAGSFSNLDLVK